MNNSRLLRFWQQEAAVFTLFPFVFFHNDLPVMINWQKKICMRHQLANSVKVDTSQLRIRLGSSLANRKRRYGAIVPTRTGAPLETH